jgi:hypothetical protein
MMTDRSTNQQRNQHCLLYRQIIITGFSPVNIIPPLLHTHLSPPHEVCDSPDQASHYHTLGPKVRASSLSGRLAEQRKEDEDYHHQYRFVLACN